MSLPRETTPLGTVWVLGREAVLETTCMLLTQYTAQHPQPLSAAGDGSPTGDVTGRVLGPRRDQGWWGWKTQGCFEGAGYPSPQNGT